MLSIRISELRTPNRSLSTFREAFSGKKKGALQKALIVTDDLLLQLVNADIIHQCDIGRIRRIVGRNRRAQELLDILQRGDKSVFRDFCDIVKSHGQLDVLKIMLPRGHHERHRVMPEELETELTELILPSSSLAEKLYSTGIINSKQRTTLRQKQSDTSRVTYLLQSIKKNWGSVKAECFLRALLEDGQSHVVNLIAGNGEGGPQCGDNCPLYEQQRRKLWCIRNASEALNLRRGSLLQLLQDRKILSAAQVDDVLLERSEEDGVRCLIKILERRSLADLKQFLVCLRETGHNGVLDRLTEVGIVAFVGSSVINHEMPEEAQLEKQKQFVQNFNKRFHVREFDLVSRICLQLEKLGIEILNVKMEQRVTWYILCRTVQSLESLRQLYYSPCNQLAEALQCIFNSLNVGAEKLQLSVEWSNEDYENCHKWFSEPSGGSFESLLPNIELSEVQEVTVSRTIRNK